MRNFLLFGLALATTLTAQVKLSPDSIAINIDGKPFTTFHYGGDEAKPFFAPLRSASGKIVTRRFPMEMVQGESRDHLHHRGLWFTYDDINGAKFWENDPSYNNKPNKGRVVVKDTKWKAGEKSGTLTANMEWRDLNGKVLLLQSQDSTFHYGPDQRIIDFHITLTAAVDVKIGDTKEGAFAIRLAEEFTEKRGVKIVNAEGLVSMKQVWGKRSNWVDYSTELGGEKLGVAMFDHPGNPGFPTYWHARDYGLFSLNPFGRAGFDESLPPNVTELKAGQKISFKWRVVIHSGDSESAGIAAMYKTFAATK